MYMYRSSLILIAFALAFVSCSKELVVSEVETRFWATIEPEVTVRSGAAEEESVIADHAILEIWMNGSRKVRQEKAMQPGAKRVAFDNVRLAGGQDYDVFVWVDCQGFYKTDDLRSVSLNSEKNYDGKTPGFDAFFAYKQIHSCQGGGVCNVVLKRPFARLNFSATVSSSAMIRFTAATTLDLKTGKVSGSKEFQYNMEPNDSGVVAFDYVFADESQSQMDYSFTLDGAQPITVSIPIERNKITNIIK